MNFLKFTRYSEWYEPKIIPLLGIGYLTIRLDHLSLKNSLIGLLFLIFSIAVGATYVSVINDVCDVKEDKAAGKLNMMQNLASWQIALILGIICGIGVYCGYLIYPDKLSLLFYTMAWVAFSLYSIYPFRLKERGILGVFADASGAHLFPTLFIICNLPYIAGITPNTTWTIITGIWAFAYGLRGILWHQFGDRDNDIAANINTFATGADPNKFKTAGVIIFGIEIVCFALMIHSLANIWLLIAGLIYTLLIVLRKLKLHTDTIIILAPKNTPSRILMHDFYLVFFPLVILLDIAVDESIAWLVLCCHILIFPHPVLRVAKDFLWAAKAKTKLI